MTQEDKKLLLKDLSARLAYGVKCTTKSLWNGIYAIVGYKDNRFFLDCPIYDEGDDEWMIESIVPYLRPMSSMSEEERKEYESFIIHKDHINAQGQEWDIDCFSFGSVPRLIDWLNAHHFDYRRLIEKGLALEAPKGMYK